ncbi:ATP-dependent RNA helicase Dbp7 [Malassezia pachydermatis]|uniref:ATP-dependent RNA helicase n=1 Tax=Malassezia pachydermatis TaxID=77020 RepID=A0A0M8MT23_9BASI|nr:dbp7-rna helicase required for 60s ribosomal subunit assembly [Malassezia pachydermatis]KOS16187.1 dbp7-rna helicase required for 60s ribosomal subunit assembly [Malassezia pachydermatis]
MDDDGLLLNFDTSTPASAPGRRREKKRSRGSESRDHGLKRARPAPTPDAQQAAKDAAADRRTVALAHAMVSGAQKDSAVKAPPKAGTGYISSLFARDEANADEPAAVPSAGPVMPSNAPQGEATFESLGLDTLIATHLRERMDICGRPTDIQRMAIPPLLASPPSSLAMRDVLMQAQTGSGKTLTYLLPILQSLLPLSEESFIDRSVGTLAIVLAPTRELARQIYQVLERLLTLSLSSKDDDGAPRRRTRWIVPGLLTGGSTKNHEKQRLRKGCTILVATPGRLLDHLQNTSSLDVGKCRWLVLDEADRLLEMGFEEQLSGIVKALEGRRRLSLQLARDALLNSGAIRSDTPDEQVTDSLGIAWWAWRRRVVLCSATLDERVQAFSGTTLKEPLLVRAGMKSAPSTVATAVPTESSATVPVASAATFAAPTQLEQHAIIVPPKLRLVTLVALLRRSVPKVAEMPTRVIVFLTCTDSVDFHWHALGGASMDGKAGAAESAEAEKDQDTPLAQKSELLPGVPIYRLHGSMTQKERIASLRHFHKLTDGTDAPPATRGGVLLCTSVASRGLDLPQVRCVIQMDVPTEGGVEEYVHRVGRTARVGQQGTSWLMLMPHEKPWLTTLAQRMVVGQPPRPAHVSLVGYDTVLYEGFGGAAREYESRATDVQMALERWVLAAPHHATLARTAFLAHIRAYATHPASERAIFHVNQLHLGHLAKAFALREAPNTVQRTAKKEHDKQTKPATKDQVRAQSTEERKRRMLANLPVESM